MRAAADRRPVAPAAPHPPHQPVGSLTPAGTTAPVAPVVEPAEGVTFVALGDSTTVGLGDPIPGGGWRGWAALLAKSYDTAVVNLAASGATSAEMAETQLPDALAMRPQLASVLVGVNDTLRGRYDAASSADHVRRTVGELTAAGATVLTARMPDPGRMLALPADFARPMSRRITGLNRRLDDIAAEFGTVHLDLSSDPLAYCRPMWSVDRLHPSELGHRHLAHRFATALTDRGWGPRQPVSLTPAGGAPTNWWADLRWLAIEGTAWTLRRSWDFFPTLAALAARERWTAVRRLLVATPAAPEAGGMPPLRRLEGAE